MTIHEKLGKAIIKLRKEQGLSQETFAYESGIDRRYMSDIENGKRNVSLDILERIADKFEVKLSDFFGAISVYYHFRGHTKMIAFAKSSP